MGKINSRRKGANFERTISNIFRENGFDTKRGVQFSQGSYGLTSSDVEGVNGLHIECKAVETLNLFKAMEQSRRDAKDDEIPVVIHKKNRTPILVSLDLDNFIKLWKIKEQYESMPNKI